MPAEAPDDYAGDSPAITVSPEIVRAAKRGDERAWRILFGQFQPAVTAYCHVCARGRRDVALDWTQEIFALAFQNLARLEDDVRFPGWLFVIARRHCLRGARQSARERQLSDELAMVLAADAPVDADLEEAERESWIATVRAACEHVQHPMHRECVLAHYTRGERTREIAARLKIPHGTVTVTLMRFRESLKKRLAEALARGELP
jgi:RNA polymerase sigma factor (sigma-70 family)